MVSIIVHGGAWNIPDEMVESHQRGVSDAVAAGWNILAAGGSSVDAVEQAIRSMENDPTFDAGRGSFVNADGDIEMDASIMNGTTFRCGAVAGIQNILNPISVARLIMDKSEHVLLSGKGALRFAEMNGMFPCPTESLLVEREVERWKKLRNNPEFSGKDSFRPVFPSDTVGAVAVDANGVITAGTSTGGTPNKYPGRIGDSPLIGCGNYADSGVAGVSCTGWGEAIITVVLAKTIIDKMEMTGCDGSAAAEYGIELLSKKADGYGGVIMLDSNGRPFSAFNTPRMARGYRTAAMNESIIEI